MFGRKSEDFDEYNERASAAYDDEYIASTDEYRADTVSSDTVSHEREENALREVTPEYLREAFKPYLMEGESLLHVFSRGGREDVDLHKKRKIMKKIIELGILCLFIVCFLALIINFVISGEVSYILMFLPFLLVPVLVVVGVIALIVWMSGLDRKADYAVTDRRILVLLDDYHNYMSYNDVSSVTCSVKRDGTGNVKIISRSSDKISFFTIPNVKDPEHFRSIIDEVVRKYQSRQC